MSSGTQIDLDWAGSALPNDGNAELGSEGASSAPPNHVPATTKYLTDEEILGLESFGTGGEPRRDSSGKNRARFTENAHRERNDKNSGSATGAENGQPDPSFENRAQTEARAIVEMPEWMRTAAADPTHSAQAQELWREHQEFRAAFASPEEARAVKELLPGGVRDVLSLRAATQSVERIDAALFSGDARAQAEVVAEIARTNPAAFRSLFAEAAKVLAAGGSRHDTGKDSRDRDSRDGDGRSRSDDGRHERRHHSGGGIPQGSQGAGDPPPVDPPDMSGGSAVTSYRTDARDPNHAERGANHESPHFDPGAYAEFERATNDTVARDVRGSIQDTLARVMPEGVADGAARRIGEDIFHEIHRALASDRALSEQVAAVLRERRFGSAERQRVSSLLAGRARQLVPSVARRVIGEWTSTVLNTARSKAARQAAAASRVDIAAPGGSLDSTPLRQMSPREVNYGSMSDEEILGM